MFFSAVTAKSREAVTYAGEGGGDISTLWDRKKEEAKLCGDTEIKEAFFPKRLSGNATHPSRNETTRKK